MDFFHVLTELLLVKQLFLTVNAPHIEVVASQIRSGLARMVCCDRGIKELIDVVTFVCLLALSLSFLPLMSLQRSGHFICLRDA